MPEPVASSPSKLDQIEVVGARGEPEPNSKEDCVVEEMLS